MHKKIKYCKLGCAFLIIFMVLLFLHDIFIPDRKLRKMNVSVNVWVVNERWLFSLMWCVGVSSVTTNSCHLLKDMKHPDWIMVRKTSAKDPPSSQQNHISEQLIQLGAVVFSEVTLNLLTCVFVRFSHLRYTG